MRSYLGAKVSRGGLELRGSREDPLGITSQDPQCCSCPQSRVSLLWPALQRRGGYPARTGLVQPTEAPARTPLQSLLDLQVERHDQALAKSVNSRTPRPPSLARSQVPKRTDLRSSQTSRGYQAPSAFLTRATSSPFDLGTRSRVSRRSLTTASSISTPKETCLADKPGEHRISLRTTP